MYDKTFKISALSSLPLSKTVDSERVELAKEKACKSIQSALKVFHKETGLWIMDIGLLPHYSFKKLDKVVLIGVTSNIDIV